MRLNLGIRAGFRGRFLGLGTAALFTSAATAAFAQATPPASSAADQSGGAIVVTALRQSTNIQKTPVQVIALSGQKLQDLAVNQLNDITYLAPSVKYTSNGGFGVTAIAMRGIGASPSGTAGAGVQVYEEEVPLTGAGLNLSPYDLNNAQVLEGPQGTLFGRNTLAGAVLLEPTLPSFSQNGYLKAGYGSYNYWTIEGAGNATIIPDVLAVRVAGQIQRRNGYVQSLSPTIGPQGALATEAFRASVLFTPNPRFRDVLTVDYFHEDDTGEPVMVYNPTANPSLPYPYPYAMYAGYVDVAGHPTVIGSELAACHHRCIDYGSVPQSWLTFQNERTAVFNTTTWDITPGIQVKNIVGFQDTTNIYSGNTLPALIPIFLAGQSQPATRLTEEAQVIGHALQNRLEARVGFYYEDDWTHGPGGFFEPNVPFYQTGASKASSEAVYGGVSFKATGRLTFRGGFRYTWDNQTNCLGLGVNGATANGTAADCFGAAAIGGGAIGAATASKSDSAPTWSYGLDFQATPDVFFFFTGSHGYRSPAVNPIFSNPCLTGGSTTSGPMCGNDIGLVLGGPATGKSINLSSIANLLPETVDNFEGGVKSQWRIGDWRMTFNIDVFHYDYNNVEDAINLGAPSTVTYDFLAGCAVTNCAAQTTFGSVEFSGGKVTATGVEGELMLMPTRDLTIDTHFSYLGQKASSSGLPGVFSAAGLDAAQLAKVANGNVIQQLTSPTSPWSFNIAARYVLPWHPLRGDLVVNYDYFWTSQWFAQNLPVPGYDLHNVRLDWNNIGGSNVSLGVWVRNLLDKDYELAAVDGPAGTADFGEPRMVGFDVTAKFH